MSIEKAVALLKTAISELTAAPVDPPPPSSVIRVTAGTDLRAAVANAPDNATLELEPGTYAGPRLKCLKPITLKSSAVMGQGRVGPSASVWITSSEVDGTALIAAPFVSLLGVGLKNSNPLAEIVAIDPIARQTVLDQVTVMGDPSNGQRRGIHADGTGMIIKRSYIGECWLVGVETQGIAGWDGCRDLLIDDCTIQGASQSVLFGGSDAKSADRMPSGIRILRSTLTKNPDWYAKQAQIKTAFECKAAAHVYVGDCILEYAGNSEGQGAYLILCTPRNQYGQAQWSRVEDVVIERVRGRYGSGAISLLGHDNVHPSGPLTGLTLRHAQFDNLTPTGPWKGDGRAIFINDGPKNVLFEHVAITGTNLGASLYAAGTPPTGLILRDVALPKSEYGIKIDGAGSGVAELQKFAPDAVLDLGPTTGPVGVPV